MNEQTENQHDMENIGSDQKKTSIFEMIVEIVKPDFLAKNMENLSPGKAWSFWFFWNTVLAFVFTAVFSIYVIGAVASLGDYLNTNYNDAKISISNGQLSIEGIQEPIFINTEKESVFVIDTKGIKYDESILGNYESGVFVSSKKIYNKKSSIETQQIDISKIKENFSISESDFSKFRGVLEMFLIGSAFIGIWFYANVFRLLSALFFALIFWVAGLAIKVREMNFEKTFYAVMYFCMIPLIINLLLLFSKINIPFLSFIILAVIFAVNFMVLKRKEKSQILEQKDSDLPKTI